MIAAHVPVLAVAPVLAIFGPPDGAGAERDAVIAVLLGAAMGAIQLRHSLAAARGERPRFGLLTLLMLAVAVYLPMGWFGWNWAASQALLIASAPMVLRGWPTRLVCTVPVLGTVAAIAIDRPLLGGGGIALGIPFLVLYWGIGLPALGLALYGSARLVSVAEQLQAARAELAELAIGQERLRVSRDLHDLLGQSLSAISLQADLAVRLLHSDQQAAREQIECLRSVARDVLQDVRTLTRQQRAVSLSTETSGAAALLAAAGIDATITVNLQDLAPPAEQMLAWAVREGVTNLLRHSDTRTCSITGERHADTARLEIINDRARQPSGGGTGLAGLAERARALSGTVSAYATDDGEFRLRIEIPAPPP